jgi:UDP-N-acetylglucosamine 2-epimerase (non-hydrolysing)
VPCITLRENTEWVETIEDGWNVLVGASKEKIVKMANDFEPKGRQRGVFGKWDASERIKKITYKTTKIDKIVKMIWKK